MYTLKTNIVLDFKSQNDWNKRASYHQPICDFTDIKGFITSCVLHCFKIIN